MYWNTSTYELTYGTDASSIRYKQDIVPLPRKYIDSIYQLNPVEYVFKENAEHRKIGFIAEEVNELIPEIVVRNAVDENVIEGLDYEHLTAPIVAILQEYQKRITSLEQLIQDYRVRLESLEQRM
jgi:hypothetical protein